MKKALLLFGSLFILFDGLAQADSYYHESTENARGFPDTSQFIPLTGKINAGLKNGTYWFIIKQSNERQILELPNTHLWDVTLHNEAGAAYPALSNTLFKTFELNPHESYLLRVVTHKEAHIPLMVYTLENFYKVEKNRFLNLGIYYGFALMVLIINVFYFLFFKEKGFLYYAIFLFSISLLLFHRDGLFNFYVGSQRVNHLIEPLIHILVPTSGIIFAVDYLGLHENWRSHKFVVWPLVISTAAFMGLYLFYNNFLLYVLADVCAISVLLVLWLSGVWLSFKHTFPMFFSLAYSIIFVLAFDFFISPLFGWPNIGITTAYLKIGGYFEMLLLSFAVVYRMQLLQKENEQMKSELFDYTKEVSSMENELQKLKNGQQNTISTEKLSLREIEILEKIAEGKANKQIADELYISVNTVKFHTKNLYAKLNVKGRSELVRQKTQAK